MMEPPAKNRDEIFHAAAEIVDADQRAAYLRSACGDDAALRSEIEELLQHDAGEDSLLDAPSHELHATIDMPMTEGPGAQIGPYKLLQQIGEGGMGVVYMAEQREPIKRRVALKVVKPGMDSRQVIARFEAERQALAMMDHPNIAKVLDVGATPSGRPYFVMELVKGETITEYCNAKRLTIRERIELLMPVLRAIQHAHQKGVIHRDIKPSNVLVGLYDQEAVPKVIDFGVAKAMHQPLTEKTMFTGFGQVIGTLGYMSPEQARVNNLDIDTRSDIYSLGVLLYELLSGLPPFDPERLRVAAIDELLRILRDEQPPKPSTRLSTAKESVPSIAAQRGIAPSRIAPLLSGELDWVIMKALEKDRDRRYETADALAKDLQRFLDDDAVEARPPSVTYRLGKFTRQHKLPIAVVTLVLATLVTALTLVSGSLVQTRRAKQAAEDATLLAEQRLAEVQAAEAETIEAYRSSLDDAINRLILSQDEISEEGRSYLEDSLERWLQFAERKGDDPHTMRIRAQAYASAGRIYSNLDDYEKAAESYDQSIEIYREITEQTGAADDRYALGVSLNDRARFTYSMGDAPLSLEMDEEAYAILKDLRKEFPERLEYGKSLSVVCNALGVHVREAEKLSLSSAYFQEAISIAEELVKRFPNENLEQLSLLPTSNIAKNHRIQGHLDLALESQLAVVETHRRMDARNPGENQRAFATSLFNLSLILSQLERWPETVTALEECVNEFREYTERYPSPLVPKLQLAWAINNLGYCHDQQGSPELAEKYYAEAHEIKRWLHEKEPDNWHFASHFYSSLNQRGRRRMWLDLIGAREDFSTALRGRRDAVSTESPAQSSQFHVADNLIGLANVSFLSKDYQQCRQLLDEAEPVLVELLETFQAQEKRDSVLRHLVELSTLRGQIEIRLDQTQAGRTYFARAKAHAEELAGDQSPNRNDLLLLATSLSRCGEWRQALDIAEDQRKASDLRRSDLETLAMIYVLVHQHSTETPNDYAPTAIKILREAAELGFSNTNMLLNHPDFQSMREVPAFQALVAELEQKNASHAKQ